MRVVAWLWLGFDQESPFAGRGISEALMGVRPAGAVLARPADPTRSSMD